MDEDANKPVVTEEQAPSEPQEEAPEAPETPEPETPEQPEEEPQASAEEEVENVDPQPMSRRKAKRLEKLEGLVQRLRGAEPPKTQPDSGINYRDMIQADDDVYQQLEQASQTYGQQQYQQGLQEAKAIQFHTRLEIDAPRVEAKYAQFNKESSEFNPAMADAINQWYLASVGFDAKTGYVANPNVRYAEFVEGIMELADTMASTKTAKTTQNIAKQAASTGLRPDGSSAKPLNLNKAPHEMTNEELNAAISGSLPRDARGRFTQR